LAVCLALPAAASAATPDGPLKVTVGKTVHVLAKVAAIVDVRFTCEPFLIPDPETGAMVESTIGHMIFGGVTLTQASGKVVSVAGADFPDATVVCDGVSVQKQSVTIMATTRPWKAGAAVVSARVQVYDDLRESRQMGESGPVVVKLRK
jgi:hypothetical protein